MSSTKNGLTLADLATLAEDADIAESPKRGGGGGAAPRTTDELWAVFNDPTSASAGRLTVNGKAGDLTDAQIAAVIVHRESVGGAAYAISYQSRQEPDASTAELTQLARDLRTNRNTISSRTLALMESIDETSATEVENDPIGLCRTLVQQERALYGVVQELTKRGEFGVTADEVEPASISDQGSVDGVEDPEAPFLSDDEDDDTDA